MAGAQLRKQPGVLRVREGLSRPDGAHLTQRHSFIVEECILSHGLSRDSIAENRPETQVFVDNDPATGV